MQANTLILEGVKDNIFIGSPSDKKAAGIAKPEIILVGLVLNDLFRPLKSGIIPEKANRSSLYGGCANAFG